MNLDIAKFRNVETPFYYYDCDLLRKTIEIVKAEVAKYSKNKVHYAIKANSNPRVLNILSAAGFGADCVSGGEIKLALETGFPASEIVYAGVGKSDKEINLALDSNIHCFNVESIAELEVINFLAGERGKVANIALRINPNVDAKTHHHITTGLNENKFGIDSSVVDKVLETLKTLTNVKMIGIHFHIGSQIMDFTCFEELTEKINIIRQLINSQGIELESINVGGGLGIDYDLPQSNPIPDFASYFEIFNSKLERDSETLHYELGRSIVGQCGALISRVLYVKEGKTKQFAILDAGMTELIRPALYQAEHRMENLSSDGIEGKYDVVGPICETSDCFGKDIKLNKTVRGDIMAILSCGAYGEVMASTYNSRTIVSSYLSDEL